MSELASESAPAPARRPDTPTRMQRLRQALSGWPKLIVPFLVQNIGWFIGGFCFVAGVQFLVANTTGFVNALVVFGSLCGAAAFLLWAGYQFRRRRPELVATSSMLLTLAVLLGPLVLADAVRLIDASRGDAVLMMLSVPLGLATLAAFAWGAALAGALMDRALQGRFPRLLAALAAVQLAAPLAWVAPGWPVLGALHVVLLALLSYGLWSFTGEWLRRLFVDQRLTTWFAAGTLVYTAAVSFIHLTWVWPQPLPAGYLGPYLMALTSLLLPVDAAFKEWVSKYAFLSRFSFLLYGLSAVAVAVAVQSTPAALLTLTMGAVLYGWMTWRYRTLPPLYLLIACLGGLYGFAVLSGLPPAWHGLASLPGLLALLGLARLAAARSRNLALQCLAAGALLLLGVTVWSLVWTPLGEPPGFATAATAALLMYAAVRLALALPQADPRWAGADAAVIVLGTAAVVWLPDWLPLDWALRTAFGLLALAVPWAALGLHDRRQLPASRRLFSAAAVTNIPLALALGGLALWPGLFGRLEPILLLALAGTLLLWLSLVLRRQSLFYAALACAGVIGALIKRGYFPGPGTGLAAFCLVPVLWAFLWRLQRRARLQGLLQADPDAVPHRADPQPPGPRDTGLAAVVQAPLEQAMALLWSLGLVHLVPRLLETTAGPGRPWIAALAAASGLLIVGYFHLFRWISVPMLLGLAGLLAGLGQLELTWPWRLAAAMLYALLIWRAGVALLVRPLTGRLARVLGFTVPGGTGGGRQIEASLHACTLLTAAVVLSVVLTLARLGVPMPSLLPALTLCLLAFLLTGRYHRTPLHAWAALITLVLGAWLTAAWLAPPVLFALGQPGLNALLSLGLTAAAVGLGSRLAPGTPLAWWRTPLQATGGGLYLLALAGAPLAALAGDARLPILLGLLCVALFPATRPLAKAPQWRGPALALLSTALVWSLAAPTHLDLRTGVWTAVGWGLALSALGNLALPRWNARRPDWAVATPAWLLLGLVAVLGGVTIGVLTGVWSPAAALAGLALYLLLLQSNTAWPGLPWLAVAALAGSGLLAAGVLEWTWWDLGLGRPAPSGEFAAALLWVNLLFLLLALWRRQGPTLARWLSWRQEGLAAPLFWIPFAILVLLLARLVLVAAGSLPWFGTLRLAPTAGLHSPLALLLAATAAHAVWRRPEQLTAQVLLAALAVTVPTLLHDLAIPLAWLPLGLALWCGVLLLAWRYGPHRTERWRAALRPWLDLLPIAALGLLVPLAGTDWAVWTLTLLLLALTALARGWWQGSAFWLNFGLLLALAALAGGYAMSLAGMPLLAITRMLPWYALQTVLLLAVFMVVRQRLRRWLAGAHPAADAGLRTRLRGVERTVTGLIWVLLSLSLLWLGWHTWFLVTYLAGSGPPPWHFGQTADAAATGAALLLLAGLAVVRAWRQPDEPEWVYAGVLLTGLLVVYGRLVLLGLSPFTPWDSIALLAAAAGVLVLHRVTGLRHLYPLALLLPLLAVATAPWQLASHWTGGVLLAAAVLYLSLAHTLRNPWPLYLGVLALNGVVYLWAPLWAEHWGLWQFYIVPAAISVLVLLHLHRRELRPRVCNGARLAALSALYAGAGLDLFLRPELGVFVLALALALAGVFIGIALQIRVFLYGGVAFLVLNVGGQMVRFYPDQGNTRALILMGLGAAITGGMVVFNLRREAILQRIRIARADLAQWN